MLFESGLYRVAHICKHNKQFLNAQQYIPGTQQILFQTQHVHAKYNN